MKSIPQVSLALQMEAQTLPESGCPRLALIEYSKFLPFLVFAEAINSISGGNIYR